MKQLTTEARQDSDRAAGPRPGLSSPGLALLARLFLALISTETTRPRPSALFRGLAAQPRRGLYAEFSPFFFRATRR